MKTVFALFCEQPSETAIFCKKKRKKEKLLVVVFVLQRKLLLSPKAFH
jgi:hypothetical protein